MTLVDDQDARAELRESARRVVEQQLPMSRVRSLVEGDARDAGLWRLFADLGWVGLTVPEHLGGSGGSFLDLAVVLTELGRHVAPTAIFSTAVLGLGALMAAGTDEQREGLIPAICAGEVTATVAMTGPSGGIATEDLSVTASSGEGGITLTGSAGFGPDADAADKVIVAARDEGGLSLVVVDRDQPGLETFVTPMADMTRRLCTVNLHDVSVAPTAVLGRRGEAGPTLVRLVDQASVALAADSLGGAEHALELTVAYAKDRVQFGRPIGSFQAVKHHCADMLVMVETARAAATASARALVADAQPAASEWAAIAKSHCADAYADVTALAVQSHGGIGFTWEHDIHLFLKRARLNQQLMGNSTFHRTRLAQLLLDPAPPVM